jgi:hypothetical protein
MCGMRSIGVVKTATKKLPMAYLRNIELHERGDGGGGCVIARDADGTPRLMVFLWMDRDRRYFIASGSSLGEDTPFVSQRWRQIMAGRSPEKVELTVPQPLAAEVYYTTCAVIDQHNRDRQDTLMIERKLKTHDWATRVNLSIFAIILVDCWRVYSKLSFNQSNKIEVQKDFNAHLAAEIIDNYFDRVAPALGRSPSSIDDDEDADMFCRTTGAPRCGVSAHLTPTNRKRKTRARQRLTYSLQG